MRHFYNSVAIFFSLCVLPAVAAEDDHWDTQFGPPGADGTVYDITSSGGNVFLTGSFFSAGESGCVGIAKWDGANWSGFGSGFNAQPFPYGFAVATRGSEMFVGGYYITNISGVAVDNLARWDGTSWSDLGVDVNGYVYSLLATEHDLYAGGVFTRIGGIDATNIARWDGTNWFPLGNGVSVVTNNISAGALTLALATNGDLIVGGNFVYAGDVVANNLARWDGSQWHALGGGVNDSTRLVVNDIAVLENNVYVAGVFKSAGGVNATNLARWDGSQWYPMGGGPSGTNTALAIVGTTIYTAGNFTNIGSVAARHVARWNGGAWEALAPGTAGEILTSVACLGSDGTNLYAGGSFIQAGNAGVLGIARWDGSQWSALTGPKSKGAWLSGVALAADGTNVYIGGSGVRVAGGVRPYAIAHWDGSAWDDMGGGVTGGGGNVYSILKDSGNVYVGGNFTNAGGVTTKNIAYWDGGNWHAMASGLNGSVYALCMHNNQLFAGGSFTARGNNGTENLPGIARWDGNDWVGVPLISWWRINNVIYALLSDGDNLYVGGNYTIGWFEPPPSTAGTNLDNIGYWDGTYWWPLGAGLSNTVYSLAFVGSDLYAGGNFTKAGGNVNMLRLAKWSGGAWSQVGNGFANGTVQTLAAKDSTLYVGGSFTNAVGLSGTNRVLKWTGGTWQTLGSGVSKIYPSSSSVSGIAISGDDVYMSGLFTYAGGRPSAAFARWNETMSFVPPTIQLLNPGLDGLGQFHFDISGLSSGTFTVQAASAVTNWLDIHSDSVPNTNFTDVDSPMIPARVYRVKAP